MNCGTTIDDLMKLVARTEEHARDTHCELAVMAPVAVRMPPVFDVLAHQASGAFFVAQQPEMAMIGVA